MTERSADPHQIQSELEAVDDYQAPPRDHEQGTRRAQPSAAQEKNVDLTLLESQQERQKPEMSDTKRTPSSPPGIDISGKDEVGDPADPGAPPPGERM